MWVGGQIQAVLEQLAHSDEMRDGAKYTKTSKYLIVDGKVRFLLLFTAKLGFFA
jgi:hypothetical protein